MTRQVFIKHPHQEQLKADPERHAGGADKSPCHGGAYNKSRGGEEADTTTTRSSYTCKTKAHLNNDTGKMPLLSPV